MELKNNINMINKEVIESLFLIRTVNLLKTENYIDDEHAKKSIVKIKENAHSKKNK